MMSGPAGSLAGSAGNGCGSSRSAGAFALIWIPIGGRECDTPELGRGLGEFQTHFRSAAVVITLKNYGAGKLFLSLRIADDELLTALHLGSQQHEAAVRVHSDSLCLFLKQLAFGCADLDGHSNPHSLRPTRLGINFAFRVARRFLNVCHTSLPSIDTQQALQLATIPIRRSAASGFSSWNGSFP